MGKLKALKPSVGLIGPRIGYAPGDEKAQDKARNDAAPWRRWYKTARWRRLRDAVLMRDGYQCQMCGRVKANTSKLVCDHVEPHRGNAHLFWDESNLQCLCAWCHSSDKQREESQQPSI